METGTPAVKRSVLKSVNDARGLNAMNMPQVVKLNLRMLKDEDKAVRKISEDFIRELDLAGIENPMDIYNVYDDFLYKIRSEDWAKLKIDKKKYFEILESVLKSLATIRIDRVRSISDRGEILGIFLKVAVCKDDEGVEITTVKALGNFMDSIDYYKPVIAALRIAVEFGTKNVKLAAIEAIAKPDFAKLTATSDYSEPDIIAQVLMEPMLDEKEDMEVRCKAADKL